MDRKINQILDRPQRKDIKNQALMTIFAETEPDLGLDDFDKWKEENQALFEEFEATGLDWINFSQWERLNRWLEGEKVALSDFLEGRFQGQDYRLDLAFGSENQIEFQFNPHHGADQFINFQITLNLEDFKNLDPKERLFLATHEVAHLKLWILDGRAGLLNKLEYKNFLRERNFNNIPLTNFYDHIINILSDLRCDRLTIAARPDQAANIREFCLSNGMPLYSKPEETEPPAEPTEPESWDLKRIQRGVDFSETHLAEDPYNQLMFMIYHYRTSLIRAKQVYHKELNPEGIHRMDDLTAEIVHQPIGEAYGILLEKLSENYSEETQLWSPLLDFIRKQFKVSVFNQGGKNPVKRDTQCFNIARHTTIVGENINLNFAKTQFLKIIEEIGNFCKIDKRETKKMTFIEWMDLSFEKMYAQITDGSTRDFRFDSGNIADIRRRLMDPILTMLMFLNEDLKKMPELPKIMTRFKMPDFLEDIGQGERREGKGKKPLPGETGNVNRKQAIILEVNPDGSLKIEILDENGNPTGKIIDIQPSQIRISDEEGDPSLLSRLNRLINIHDQRQNPDYQSKKSHLKHRQDIINHFQPEQKDEVNEVLDQMEIFEKHLTHLIDDFADFLRELAIKEKENRRKKKPKKKKKNSLKRQPATEGTLNMPALIEHLPGLISRTTTDPPIFETVTKDKPAPDPETLVIPLILMLDRSGSMNQPFFIKELEGLPNVNKNMGLRALMWILEKAADQLEEENIYLYRYSIGFGVNSEIIEDPREELDQDRELIGMEKKIQLVRKLLKLHHKDGSTKDKEAWKLTKEILKQDPYLKGEMQPALLQITDGDFHEYLTNHKIRTVTPILKGSTGIFLDEKKQGQNSSLKELQRRHETVVVASGIAAIIKELQNLWSKKD
jgi:hypothetical protein